MKELDLKGIEWEEVNREKWEDRLRKELKTEDLNDHKIHLERSIIYDPLKANLREAPEAVKAFSTLSYGQRISIDSPEKSNDALLTLLKNDLRVLSIEAHEKTQWKKLLKNVLPELIHLDINFNSLGARFGFDDYKARQENANEWSVSCNAEFLKQKDIPRLDYKNLIGLTQVEKIKCALLDVSLLDASKIKVCFTIEENLLKIIPFLRAMRIAFEKTFPDKHLIIEADCPVDTLSDNKNDALVRAGAVYLFCTMAGVDHLYLSALNELDDLDHCRLLLNVQNMMTLESKVDDKKDPLAGSYVIEDLTMQFLEAVLPMDL